MSLQHSNHTLRLLIASMAAIAIAVSASTILLLYRTAYNQTLREMQFSAGTMANLIEAVAQFDKRNSEHTHPQGHWGATMSQVEAGILMQARAQQTGEFIIGRRLGKELQVFRAIPGKGLHEAARLPFDGVRARPLYLALRGERGSGEMPDYAGTSVLAGYAPVPTLEIGVVYKIDTAAVRAPFIRASLWAAAMGALLIALGAAIFTRVTRPLQRRITESEQRFSTLVSSAPTGVFEADANGRYTFVNDRLCQFAGLPAAQMLGENWLQALHPEDRERVQCAWDNFVRQAIPFDLEFRFLRPDGSVRWFYGQARSLTDSEHKVRSHTGTLTDITESVQARAAAQISGEHLKEAQRLAQVGSWELDLHSNQLTWSDEIFRIFEIDKSNFAASYEAFLNAIHPEDRAAVNQAYSDSVANRTPYKIEHRLLLEDGRVKWVQERGTTFYDASGKPIRSTGTVQDISVLKSVQQELDLHRTHLEQLVTQRTAQLEDAQRIARLGNWSWDVASGKITWSDEIYRIFGHAPRSFEPSYERFIAALHPDDVARIKESERLAFARGERHSIDHRIILPDGAVRWVHEEAVATLDANGQALRLTGTVQDITARKQAEESLLHAKQEAERANAAKSEFLSRMSHELRTPMNAILGFSQVLELESQNPEQRSFAMEIQQAGKHLLHLIDELLDLSRIDAGKLAISIEPVNLAPILSSALQLAQPAIQGRGINIINQCHDAVAVLADSTRLRQILLNLISNAAKYNHEGGNIHIDCQARDDLTWRISIADTGPGIAPENLSKLFMPFERLGAEFTVVDGTGIGLSLCRKLADLMGATLGVSSTPGQGSTFWIDLPRAAPTREARAAIALTTDPMKRIKVLYIEDNAANLKVVEAMLRRHPDLSLISATNGEYGLELARLYRPDAILLDIHLPGMDGYAVLAALQADSATRDIPVLALSADAMPIDAERGLKAGFVRYITKPVKMEDLMDAVLAALLMRNKTRPVE